VPTLLFKLVGPMQSWGSRSRFDLRDTEQFPTKSGVLGLVAAALGRDREEPVDDLAELRFGVRVDREGIIRYDFQTALHVRKAGINKKTGNFIIYALNSEEKSKLSKYLKSWLNIKDISIQIDPKNRTTTSKRYYLSDAAFLAGLEGDEMLLKAIESALKNPKWPLFLGRKGYPPGEPVHFAEGGITNESLEAALARKEPIAPPRNPDEASVRYAIELAPGCEPGFPWLVHEIWDQPTAPFSERRFGARRVGVASFERGEVPKPCT